MEEQTEVIEKKSIAWGISSLVTSIIGLGLFLMPYFGLPLSIFSIVARYKQTKIKESGMATAGLVIGIIGCILNSIVGFFLALVFIGMYLGGTL